MDNINAKQLNNTIDEIVKEAKTFKSVVEMQKEIASTKNDIQKSSANIEKLLAEELKNSKTLGELIKENSSFITSVNSFNEKVKEQNVLFQKELVTLIERQHSDLKEENNSFIASVNSFNEKVKQQNVLFQKELATLIERQHSDLKEEHNKFNASNHELHKKLFTGVEAKFEEFQRQNKEFQKELDSSIFTRLEKHKSDIQIEIRSEGTQIQRAFENTITSNFNSIETKLKEKFSEISKQNNILKNLIYVMLLITVGLLIKSFF